MKITKRRPILINPTNYNKEVENIEEQNHSRVPSTDAHAVQIHSKEGPLEQLQFQGTRHKQNPSDGHTYQSE